MAGDRRPHAEAVRRVLRPGGHVIIATSGPDEPTRCSGLEVVRYSPEALAGELGRGFRPIEARSEEHRTPGGGVQHIVHGLSQRE